ncbi:LETM1-like protein-domain-containing protein [Cantharellus anzutake]|uniref:LETM1-like protein-domain-containing protein n=1 Tax=Cantharellus anzutake TaxID=1750568 RepID=UPI001905F5E2|nr:LETM1-like protein-domain-containing protein [Cantharellus anzutake]KAF8326351.1 LETM1-like protein-domain-containing protein [Cantharellus anzutake]
MVVQEHHLLLRSTHQQRILPFRYNSTSATESGKSSSVSATNSSEVSSSGPSKSTSPNLIKDAERDISNVNITQKKSTEAPKQPLLTRAWQKIKHEANHYWDGTKLLASEIKISARLLRRTLQGKALTRRERRQLRRTTQDLLRLIPFSVFVIVPFMELLLPVAIKLFPNMLPSTFEDKFAADEKQRKLLRVRLEMAKFLQETLLESGIKGGKSIVGTEEFKEFFYKVVRSTGDRPSTEDIIKVAKLFDDELTVDNLSRPQLVSMCRYMNINAFGTDNYLKYQIRKRLEHIKRDDKLIAAEAVDSLSTAELQHACQSRGVRTMGVSPSRLREELDNWIDLHLNHDISGVLLILSRAFDWGENRGSDGVIQSLAGVLSSLPDPLLNETELAVDSEKASYKQKLEVLQQQEELIEDEAEQEKKEEDARRARKELEERQKLEEEQRVVQSMLPDSELVVEPEADDARMTTEQLAELGEALVILCAKSSVLKERDELGAIMEQNLQSEEETSGEASPSQSLSKRIRGMLNKVDKQLDDYDFRVGSSLQQITADQQGRISIRDLRHALSVIKHKPDAETVDGIVKKLDPDHDGYVLLEHVLDLVKEEGLGILVDDNAKDILGQGKELRELRPKKEDIIQE